ncbi:MAG TPA: hypothetical protein PK967_13190 [Candidatus Hydrogenedentes bacterium]|nr:hypothetical protein [Candidatus Hydrogenedentota bacterium]
MKKPRKTKKETGPIYDLYRSFFPSSPHLVSENSKDLVAGWLAARGFNVVRSGDSDADRIIENKRVEIKISTLWANGCYKFQQLRDQRYDLAICLGISPFDAHCWIIPKEDILRLWKVEHRISSQHGGQGGADTAWIDVHPDNPPAWLQCYGGSPSDAIFALSKITGFKVKKLREELEEYEA